MSKYIHFTAEQKRRANQVDRVEFLRSRGEELECSGGEWRWKRHDSDTVRSNRWYRHRRGDFMCRWSKTQQRLEEEFLCESLHGGVKFFSTRYRHSHDGLGRVCILVDNKETLSMPFNVEYNRYEEAHKRKDNTAKSLREIYENVNFDFSMQGNFGSGDFGFALDKYFNLSIADALKSKNLLG